MLRIAIAGFQHETNSYAPWPTDLKAFEMADSWPGLLNRAEVVSGTKGLNVPIAGFVDAAEAADLAVELCPILWCAAEPAGPVTDHAFETIAARICDGLDSAAPLDGLYLDLHGAMITQSDRDGEGALLQRIRACIGARVPLVVSLDLHANVSPRMVDLVDVLCLFRTYPHLDMAETGARAWRWLLRCLSEGPPAKAFRQSDFLFPMHAQDTGAEPARSLYAHLLDSPDSCVDMALGFTAGDTADRVPSVVAFAGSQAEASRLADAALDRLAGARDKIATRLLAPADAVNEAMAAPPDRPVVLADVQDNPGAGASSDTTGLLRALVAAKASGVLMGLIHDPVLAKVAHEAGPGAMITGALGGRSGLADDTPFAARFRVETLSDGACRYTGEMYGGGVATLGPSAVLSLPETGADIRVVITSIRTQCLDLAHFTSFGLDPHAARILCVKSTAHFRADFEPIAGQVICVAAPGLCPCQPEVLDQIAASMDTSV
ncbi:MAG: M81 family metallopeptidase [Pseudomonadota bacterium]